MKRITISLPDSLAMILLDEARRRRRSVSELAREAIAGHLDADETKPRHIPFAGIGASKEGDIASRADDYLAATWARAIEADRG
jgi:Arc/MetJ-type ribon-helix-helix transcriptional regulator